LIHLVFVELESCLAESGSTLDQVIGKVDSLLVAFEPKGLPLVRRC
jgi:hypothetical protein